MEQKIITVNGLLVGVMENNTFDMDCFEAIEGYVKGFKYDKNKEMEIMFGDCKFLFSYNQICDIRKWRYIMERINQADISNKIIRNYKRGLITRSEMIVQVCSITGMDVRKAVEVLP